MILKLWFKCAAMHDPVCPRILSPCAISWEAKYRDIDLVIERPLKGEELVKRMNGWVTVDVYDLISVVKKYGKFIIDNNGSLFIQVENNKNFNELKKELSSKFASEVILENV